MHKQLSVKHENFCQQYMVDRNGAAAYLRAGYKAKNSNVAAASAARLLAKVNIQERLAALSADKAEKIDFGADDLLKILMDQATLDRTSFMSHMYVCCRYCHGKNNEYQWRTAREFEQARYEYHNTLVSNRKTASEPNDNGGYGYTTKLKPHDDCPECDGMGKSVVRYIDTTTMTDAQKSVFKGVTSTPNGPRFLLADPDKALDRLAKCLGLYEKINKSNNESISDGMAKWLKDLNRRGSKMELTTQRTRPYKEVNGVVIPLEGPYAD